MLKFYRILLLTLVAVFIASAAGIARYAADSCTQTRMYRQLAAQTEKIPDDAVSTGNDFLPQYQALYAQNSDLAGWIQIDGTNINYPVMQSKHDPDFYLKHNFEKADSPHGCPYVQANCDLQTPSDNILVYGHNMKDGTMFSDLLQYKRESFWEQHRIIRFDTMTAQAEYTVMAVFRGEAEDLFAYYQCTDTETPQEFAAYVDACKNAALYETGVTAAYGDKLLISAAAPLQQLVPVAGHRQAVCRRRAAGAGAWLRRVSTVSLLGWWAGMRKKEPLLPVLILGLLAFTVLWPLWFTVGGALMASDELTAALGPALLDTADGGYAVWTILPSWPTLQPLAELLLDTPQFFLAFWNTCLLAFAQIAGQLVVAAPASWAFAKLRFAGRRFLLLGYIALMVLPFQVLMVPNYLIATRLGIYDTPLSVILPGVFSAFPVFIMTRSFQDVPNELLEAAKLDGATAWQIFWKIGVPLGYAGIFAALVLNFIEGWNAVEQPLLFLKSQSNWPLSMYMNDIVTDNLGIAMAASLLSLIPAMLVFLYGQTYLELGIQAGGIKA